MPETPRNGTPPRDNEAATLWADLGDGARNYQRMKQNDWLDFQERQYHRRLETEKINAAPLVGEMVAGYPWRLAWIKVQADLATDGKFDEMMGPEEWYESKRSTGTD